jgi:hypothetical protein
MEIRRMADRKQRLAGGNQETDRQKAGDSQMAIRRLADRKQSLADGNWETYRQKAGDLGDRKQ